MALNFPADPAINETYPVNGVVYRWDGNKWTAKGATTGLPLVPDGNGNVIITGSLTVQGDTITANDYIGDNLDLEGNLNVAGDIDND